MVGIALLLGTEERLFRFVGSSHCLVEDGDGTGSCWRLSAVGGSIRPLVWIALRVQIYRFFRFCVDVLS